MTPRCDNVIGLSQLTFSPRSSYHDTGILCRDFFVVFLHGVSR